MISDEDADETLTKALDFARTPHGTVDNVMRVHSLRPSTMTGHVALYRACLHDPHTAVLAQVPAGPVAPGLDRDVPGAGVFF